MVQIKIQPKIQKEKAYIKMSVAGKIQKSRILLYH